MNEFEIIIKAIQTAGEAGTTVFAWWCIKEQITSTLLAIVVSFTVLTVKTIIFRLEWNTRMLHKLRAIAVPRNANNHEVSITDINEMEAIIKRGMEKE